MAPDWKDKKEEIRQLYLVQGLSLAQTRREMERRYFYRSERSYKYYLAHWGFRKTKRARTGSGWSPGLLENEAATVDLRSPAESDGSPLSPVSDASNTGYAQTAQLSLLASNPADMYVPDPLVQRWADYTVAGEDLAAYDLDIAGFSVTQSVSLDAADLHDAVLHENEHLVKDLLRQGAPVDIEDMSGNLPLHYALYHGSRNMVKLLLGYDDDDNGEPLVNPEHVHSTLCHRDAIGDTPLHLAISPGSLELAHENSILTFLLEAGANPHTPNELGISPLQMVVDLTSPSMNGNHARHLNTMLATWPDHLTEEVKNSLFELFLTKSDNAWMKAETAPNASFRCFLAHGADADTPTGPKSQRLLRYFLDHCYDSRHPSKICDLQLATLICQELEVTKVSLERDTCLHELVRFVGAGNYSPSISDLIEVVVKRNADVNHVNADGKTPLMLLMEKRQLIDEVHNVLEFLLSNGADPWIPDAMGDLAIYAAVRNNPKMGLTLGKTILHANYKPGPTITCHDGWWQSWNYAVTLSDWDRASELLEHASNLLPLSVERPILQLALTVLAEKYLQRATNWYLGSEMGSEERNRHLVIVNELLTKSYGLNIDRKWFDYLFLLYRSASIG